ncbi:MAG TPA: DNA adenine methylase, partial [Nitrospirota bacterium]
HERLLERLKALKGRFLLSYEDHPDIRKMYKSFKIESLGTLRRTLNNRVDAPKRAGEILIRNY